MLAEKSTTARHLAAPDELDASHGAKRGLRTRSPPGRSASRELRQRWSASDTPGPGQDLERRIRRRMRSFRAGRLAVRSGRGENAGESRRITEPAAGTFPS